MIDWQVYTAFGTQVPQKGTNHDSAFSSGTPHGASHIWIWKSENEKIYLLFQVSSRNVSYKAGMLDISAAGHVDMGETELEAAKRETEEELGVQLQDNDLYFAGVEHYQRKTDDSHKDEFRFVYTVKYHAGMEFVYPDGEVDGVEWIEANSSEEMLNRDDFSERFVQHSEHYFNIVFSGINGQALVSPKPNVS
jgi:isopentenyl-diphosphate Delta-isomerase